jgi:hypothetical protein
MKHTDFVDSAIQDLLDRGLIVTCEVQPTVVNPLTVYIHSNGKKQYSAYLSIKSFPKDTSNKLFTELQKLNVEFNIYQYYYAERYDQKPYNSSSQEKKY